MELLDEFYCMMHLKINLDLLQIRLYKISQKK